VEGGSLTPYLARRQVADVSTKLHKELEDKIGTARMRSFRAAASNLLIQLKPN
jgi:hypothetical protein